MKYSPYNISHSTTTGYNVPTHNANNINGENQIINLNIKENEKF